jgi:hypothetical protein
MLPGAGEIVTAVYGSGRRSNSGKTFVYPMVESVADLAGTAAATCESEPPECKAR